MPDMYNNKPRQAEGSPEEAGRRRTAPERWRKRPMLTNVLNSILGLYIILVLVLVVLVSKQNSAFGHAQNKGATGGFLQRAA